MARFVFLLLGFGLGIVFSKLVLITSPLSTPTEDLSELLNPDNDIITENTSELVKEKSQQCPPCEKMKISQASDINSNAEESLLGEDDEGGSEIDSAQEEVNGSGTKLSLAGQKTLNLIEEGITNRSFTKLSEEDLKDIKDNLLTDPALSAARSKLINSIELISPLNGKYKGRHYYRPSSSAEGLNDVYSELEIAYGPKDGRIEGNFKLIFYDENGKKISNSTGSGNNGDIFYNKKEDLYIIKFHGGYVLQVTNYSGNQFKGNIYKGSDFVGTASYKKIY